MSTNVRFLIQDLIQDTMLHLVTTSPYSPPLCDSFSVLLAFSCSWHFWRALVKYVAWHLSSWVCLMCFHDQIEVKHFWQKYHRSDVFFSVHYLRYKWCQYVLLLVMPTLITWVNCCLPTFSTPKKYFFSFVINEHLMEDTLRSCKYPVSHHALSTDLSIHRPLIILNNKNYYCNVCPMMIIHFIPSTFINWNFPVRKSRPFSFIN